MKIPKFLLRGFTRPSEALVASLGSLERDAMREVWRQKEASVRQISAALGEQNAYTTVMTTLDRLYKKGLLNRRKQGRAFFYSPRFSPEELERGVTQDVIGSLLDTGDAAVKPVLACIVDAVSERDLVLLDELERLVQSKRREISGEE
ncbi:MAG: BlaI/MecI/CopY family transcriptional regulator [Acidobacteriota bacterium]|nr:BlaI/MecI/CopY family transcriptional regulator [Acidobacteriota bacterium]